MSSTLEQREQAFVRFFELFDEYTKLQNELGTHMKNGFFDIVQVRRRGTNSSDFCYPSYIPTMKIPPFVKLMSTKVGFDIVKNIESNETVTINKPTSTLVQRKHKEVKEEKKPAPIVTDQSSPDYNPYLRDRDVSQTLLARDKEMELQKQDPMYWYSLIPPDELRNAQKSFKKSLDIITKLAAVALEMNELEREWNK